MTHDKLKQSFIFFANVNSYKNLKCMCIFLKKNYWVGNPVVYCHVWEVSDSWFDCEA